MSQWEFTAEKEMLSLLIGHKFGDRPAERLDAIKKDRAEFALSILRKLHARKQDVGLEIGSGCGFLASVVAPRIKHLFCCDVSESFLNYAKHQCANLPNISFHLTNGFELSFLEDEQIDFAYAHAVFIHLNIYDIYWYFRELSRVLKPGGRIYLDYISAEDARFTQSAVFDEHAHHYRKNPANFQLLLKANGSAQILNLARQCGLVPVFKYAYKESLTAFAFKKIPQWQIDWGLSLFYFIYGQIEARAVGLVRLPLRLLNYLRQ